MKLVINAYNNFVVEATFYKNNNGERNSYYYNIDKDVKGGFRSFERTFRYNKYSSDQMKLYFFNDKKEMKSLSERKVYKVNTENPEKFCKMSNTNISNTFFLKEKKDHRKDKGAKQLTYMNQL